MWDVLATILRAGLRNDANIALMVLCMAFICAIVYPVISLIAGSDTLILKCATLLPFFALPSFLIWRGVQERQWLQWWQQWSMWGRCAFSVAMPAALLLIVSLFDGDIAVAIGLIVSSIGVIIIGVYAFAGRFLYAAIIEAPSSPQQTLGDSEIPANAMFRAILAILAWEWFAAWFFTTFHPQMTTHTATIAFMSFGMTAIASYALGVAASKGLKWLMYGSLIIFFAMFVMLIDQAIKNPIFQDYIVKGYIGSLIKNSNISITNMISGMGFIEWLVAIVFLDLIGTTIAWHQQKLWIRQTMFAIEAALVTYLLAYWVKSTGFSLKEHIAILTMFFDPNIAHMSREIKLGLVIAGIVGTVAGATGTVWQILKGQWPLWPAAGFSIATFLLYQLVFAK